ncbi:MAG: hypothetical protein EOP09_12470, partial [Proteobacteria bacterium]
MENPNKGDPMMRKDRQILVRGLKRCDGVVNDIAAACETWAAAINNSRFAQQAPESSYYKSAKDSLLGSLEVKCAAAYLWLWSNVFPGKNSVSYNAMCDGKSPSNKPIVFETPMGTSLRSVLCGNIVSSQDPRGVDRLKKQIPDYLRRAAKGLVDIRDLTESGGLATKDQLKERIRSIVSETSRAVRELNRTSDEAVSRGEEYRSLAENELKSSVRETEDRITRRAPQEIKALEAELKDAIFVQRNQLSYIQAQFRLAEADRLSAITVEMNRFLLDQEISRIRLTTDAKIVKIALSSLEGQLELVRKARAGLVAWNDRQMAYFGRIQVLVEKGTSIQIERDHHVVDGVLSEKAQAENGVTQARLQLRLENNRQTLQSIESKKKLEAANFRLAGYEKACSLRIDTGLSEEELHDVTQQIQASANVEMDLSIRNLEVLSQITESKSADTRELRTAFTSASERSAMLSPL